MEGSSYFKSTSITRIFNVSHDKILQLNPHFWLRKCPHKKLWNLPVSCPISSFITKLWIPRSLFRIVSQSRVNIRHFSASSPTATFYYCCSSSSSKQHYRVASHFFAITITSIGYDVISVMHAPPISSALLVRHTCMSNMYDEHAWWWCASYRFVIPVL